MLKLKSLLYESKLLLEFDSSTNIAGVSAEDIVDQLSQMQSGMDDTEIGKAMQDATGWAKGELGKSTGDASPAAMVDSIGRDKLIARIKKVQAGVKTAKPGLAKDEMPALEGGDAKNVKDALSDEAGQIAVDLKGKWGAGDGSGDFDQWWNDLDPAQQELFDTPGFKDTQKIASLLDMPTDVEDPEAYAAKGFGESKRIKLVNLLKEDPFPQYGKPFDGAPEPGDKSNLGALKGKAKAFLMKGMLDGGAKDSIDIKLNDKITNNKMIPTQSNILMAKSLVFALNQWNGNPKGDLSNMDGAFVTTGGEILDGHHRWSGAYIATGGGLSHTGVHIVTGDAATLIPILTSIGNALGRDQKGKPETKDIDTSIF